MQPGLLLVLVDVVEVFKVVLGGGVWLVLLRDVELLVLLRDVELLVVLGGGEPPVEPVVDPISPHRMLEKMT